MNKLSAKENGFTLIELAMVMIIVGLLLTIGMSLVGPLTKRAKLIEARENVKAAKEAVMGDVVKYGYLPLLLTQSGARDLDAWGRTIQYFTDNTLILPATNVCNRTSTNRTVFECGDATCTAGAANTKQDVAFIVYSIGDDANGAGTTTQPAGGPTCPVGQTCYWIRQQGTNYTVGPTAYQYDDIVQYVTLNEIRSARICSFYVTTTSLPDAKTGVAYSVNLQATGGQTPYISWSITAGALPAGITLGAANGLISGTTTTAGVYNFTVTLSDANAVTTSKDFTLLVDIGVDSTIPNSPTAVTSTRATLNSLNLTWTPPTTNTDASALTDLSGYAVYRRLGLAGAYVLLQSIGAGTSFTDTFLTPGQRYFYQMQTVDKYGNSSVSSLASSTTVSPITQTGAAATFNAATIANCGYGLAGTPGVNFSILNRGVAGDVGANITVTSVTISWTGGGGLRTIDSPTPAPFNWSSLTPAASPATITLTVPFVINAGITQTMRLCFSTDRVISNSINLQMNTADGQFILY